MTFVDAQSAMLVKSQGTIEFMNRQLNVGDAVRGMAGVMKGGRGGAGADGESPSYEGQVATYGAPMLTQGGYAMGYTNFSGGYAMDMRGSQYPMPPYGVTYQQLNHDGSPYGGPRFYPVRRMRVCARVAPTDHRSRRVASNAAPTSRQQRRSRARAEYAEATTHSRGWVRMAHRAIRRRQGYRNPGLQRSRRCPCPRRGCRSCRWG